MISWNLKGEEVPRLRRSTKMFYCKQKVNPSRVYFFDLFLLKDSQRYRSFFLNDFFFIFIFRAGCHVISPCNGEV